MSDGIDKFFARKFDRYNSAQDGGFTEWIHVGARISPARYAKNKYAIHCDSDGTGYKTRAMRLASVLGGGGSHGTYSNREHAYIVSPRAADKFIFYYTHDWDASVITGALEPPKART